ncbi:hypothetical protein [Mesorhizobium captivum]|uniref:hypothetical protein n=1 Tax=Mesorhizobium captivum TaxID=3072319 RepID=UPI002A242EB1|nr:hypothetical protein [Mesorhizobium sp. VK23E]MDX8513513.1 hypothetical protein [Mesorhizobium sp. VK23E]
MLATLFLYPVISLFGPAHGHDEFYPFFRWNLFSASAEIRGDSVIIIKEIGGVPLAKPTIFYDLGPYFAAARTKDVRLAKLLDNLVRAERSGDHAVSDHLTSVINETFMPDQAQVKYDVAVITYNALQRYRTGEILKTSIIKSTDKRL